MDNYRQAILNAGSVEAPASIYSDSPEISQYFRSAARLGAGGGGTQALGAAATIEEENRRKAEEFAKSQKMQELKERASMLQDMQDPSKYQKVRKEDGGFDFYDPQGHKITVQQYSQVRGDSPSKVLADSENSGDRQYLAHYNETQKVVNFLANGDQDGLKKYLEKNGMSYDDIKGFTPEDIINKFKSAYPNVYTVDQGGYNKGPSYAEAVLQKKPKQGGGFFNSAMSALSGLLGGGN